MASASALAGEVGSLVAEAVVLNGLGKIAIWIRSGIWPWHTYTEPNGGDTVWT